MNKRIVTLLLTTVAALGLVACTGAGSKEGSTSDFYNSYEDSVNYKQAHLQYVKFDIPMSVIEDYGKNGSVKWDSMSAAGSDYLISELSTKATLFDKKGKNETAQAIQSILGDDYELDVEGGKMMQDNDGVAKAIFPLSYESYNGYIAYITDGKDAGYILAAVNNNSYTLSDYECNYMIKSFELCDCSDFSTADPLFMYPDATSAYEEYTGADDDEYEDDEDWNEWEENQGVYTDTVRVGNDNLGYLDVPADFVEFVDPSLSEDATDYIYQYISKDGYSCISSAKFTNGISVDQYVENLVNNHIAIYPEEYVQSYDTYFLGYDAVGVYMYYDTTAAEYESVVLIYCFEDEYGDVHTLFAEAPTDEEAYELADYLYTYDMYE